MTPKIKVGYVRISDDPMGREAGVLRQEQDERAAATRRGVDLAQVYVDNDRSATTGHRPGYQQLMRQVAAGRVDTIMVWHLSRLWRNRRERAAGIELCREHGVSVWCVRGPDLDMATAYGRGTAGLLGEFDTMEVEIKGERQKAANRHAAQNGKAVRAKRLFGYNHDRTELVEDEAAAVREAFARPLAGKSVHGIVTDLNERGLLTPLPILDDVGNVKSTGRPPRRGGQKWTKSKIHGLLRNPVYAGLRVYEGEEFEGSWPRIVEPEVWRAVQRLLDNPGRFHGLPLARRWLGSGLYRCGVCGAVLHSTYRSRRSGPVRVYKCATSHLSVKADPVDEYVVGVVCALLQRPDFAQALFAEEPPDVDALRGEHEKLTRRVRELGDLFEDGDLTKPDYQARHRRLKAKLHELEEQMTPAVRAPLLKELVAAVDVAAAWAGLSLEDRRRVVDVLCVVTLRSPGGGRRPFDPDTIQLDWRG